jgi:hypothetical protein
MRKRKGVGALNGRMNGVPIGEENSEPRLVEKFGCGRAPLAVRCGTREYTIDCEKKGSGEAGMSISTAKVQRRAGIRREKK